MSDSFEFSNESSSNSRPSSRRFIKRPDDKVFKQRSDEIRSEIAKIDASLAEIDAKLTSSAIPSKTSEKRRQLQAELKSLIAKQATLKSERATIMDQVRLIDHEIKRRMTEKATLIPAKYSFRSGAEVDVRIDYLDLLISAGTSNLADERRFVKELSSLRKLRKDFISVEKIQAYIDADKGKIADLKAKASETHNKALQAEFEKTQAELNALSVSTDSISKTRDELYNSLRALRKEKDSKYDALKKNRADQDAAFAKFKKQVEDERRRYEEESKSEIAAEKLRRRKEAAKKELDVASVPAFTEEIDQICNLLKHFDPTFVKPVTSVVGAYDPLETTVNASTRKIEMPENFVVVKKEKVEFFAGSKSKKAHNKSKAAKKFTVEPATIVALSDLSIPFPTKEEEVPATINVLKETLQALQEKQADQTRTNIERAKARIAKVEAEEDAAEKAAQEAEENEESAEADADADADVKAVPETESHAADSEAESSSA